MAQLAALVDGENAYNAPADPQAKRVEHGTAADLRALSFLGG